jgi:hypothetical protein
MTGDPNLEPSAPGVTVLPAGAAVLPVPPSALPGSRLPHQLRDLGAIGLIVVFGLLADDWLASVGLLVLFIGWKYLSRESGPPIVAAAFSLQWLQVMAAIVYFAISGRQVWEMRSGGYHEMVLLGLAAVVILFTGFYLGAGLGRFKRWRERPPRLLPWSTNRIALFYLSTVAGSGVLQELAWSAPGLTQPLLVLSRIRYVLLFFLVTRLIRLKMPWPWIAGILATELTLGFSGFFAEFREPLVVVAIAVIGSMDRKRARTWVIVGGLAALAVFSAVVWTAIKPIIRRDYVAAVSRSKRLGAALTVAGETFTLGGAEWKWQTDAMVSRMWAMYYPALALNRVPSVLPHENGKIIRGAVQNVLTPRLFFPQKAALPSQSDEVRKYSGIWVSGRESNTSYAFGYVAESYVDFGIPLMFVPILGWGLLLGYAYRWLTRNIHFDELRTGVLVVICWATLTPYEASWAMMIGPAVTIMAILGVGAVLTDRFFRKTAKRQGLVPPPRVTGLMPLPYRLPR